MFVRRDRPMQLENGQMDRDGTNGTRMKKDYIWLA